MNVFSAFPRLAAAALLAASPAVLAGSPLLEQKCASCHALAAPDYAAAGLKERIERKAPPRHYAGNKFRREWLVAWLQKPARIRPAGVFPPAHVKPGPKGDTVDEATLPAHPALSAAEAEQAATELMALRAFDARIQAETYEPGSVSLRLGQMDFGKFKGCAGCHQDAPGRGGVSGPELYTAWQRLQPKFISAYIAAPNAWDPHSMLPAPDLQPDAIRKLANYLKAIGEEKK
jgi:mono/diheme cytochrome c family protein